MTTPPPENPTPDAPSGDARRYVDAARAKWLKRLIDTSRNNNLLYFRELKAGTLDMTSAHTDAMKHLLMSEEVALRKFFPDRSPAAQAAYATAEAKLTGMRSKALSNAEERGIETLYLAMGMATWPSKDGKRPPEAPILLVPIRANKSGRGGQGISLKRAGDIQANLVLLHVLRDEFKIEISPEDLLRDLQGDDEGEPFSLEPVTKVLKERCHEIEDFTTTNRVVIGNFAFQKTAMVQDLMQCAEMMAQHDLIAAIAGHPGARSSVSHGRFETDPREIDEIPPDQEFLILDSDSSQQTVIRNAMARQSGIIQGPPGTGKSQTIANLIAELTAAGRRVLFVAEKRAALQVVLDRLTHRGLGHLALDLHGAEISRSDVMQRLKESLELVSKTPVAPPTRIHTDFVKKRAVLLAHLQRIHQRRLPTERSVFQMQGRLLALGGAEAVKTRWSGSDLAALTRARIDEATDALHAVQRHGELFLRTSRSPWNRAVLEGAEEAQRALAHARFIKRELTTLLSDLGALCVKRGLAVPQDKASLDELFGLLAETDVVLGEFDGSVFAEASLEDLLSALEPARRSRVAQLWAFISNADYRAALRTVRRYWRDAPCSVSHLESRFAALLVHRARWRMAAVEVTSTPSCHEGWRTLQERWDTVLESLRALSHVLWEFDPEASPLASQLERASACADDGQSPLFIAWLYPHEQKLRRAGVQALVDECRERGAPLERPGDLVEIAWLASTLDEIFVADLDLATFQGAEHDEVVAEFRELDRQRIEYAAGRVRSAHAQRAVGVMNEHRDQEGTLRAECQKKRGKSVRRLLNEIPEVLTALRPCWMASPLSVSQLLPAAGDLFDVVLFDEASQVLPEDAIPALLRAPCAIVAGDRHQLPPTQFFAGGEETEEDADQESTEAQDFESILDQMSGLFPEWSLTWHYRSLDESLIAFSNRHIYGDRLVTFPGAGRHKAIEHHLVTPAMLSDDRDESVSDEVAKVVDLILEHATQRPHETLGVIALGIKHQMRIEKQLDIVLRTHPELDAFFDESKKERFFIKNLERVQGDERDAIILSIGFGKDLAGKVRYQFGPLNQKGGERRLNVAITRARRRLALVSSFGHREMDPSRTKARGADLMRLYLAYAESGGRVLGDARAAEVPLNDFEADIFHALQDKGLQLEPQWGVSSYRIDMVAKHPVTPGRFVLAIECDGATYHSSCTARDRDRLRQQHLEALGWRFHRIWSTDWFNDRDPEIARAVKAYEDAIVTADRLDAGGGEVSAAPPASQTPPKPASGEKKRGPLPIKVNRDTIDRYAPSELLDLVRWVQSDGRLRTDSQLLDEMVKTLDFKRGSRIVASIEEAIARYRAQG